ncbi:hypothetical protein DESPIG_01524 [Desulfovibrio piger ATCC 29098]|uniref:Uncharacterized protein n=1 Tax=Desulfovibrio piger ATCC 29098 TaxID=411464 RepID=B6WTW7_9BACT|nr:hypothetical protein DESPIG_01524 [Desulfovibrio piger ATCC 29098]
MGAFFHVAWFCSVCILPAGRRMWRGLPARALPGRSGGQRADGSSGALVRDRKGRDGRASADSVLPAGCREIRFIACVGTAPWLALGSPSIPGILSAWTTDAIRQGQEKCAQSRRPS